MQNESPSPFSGLQSIISSITFLFSILPPSYFLISFPTTVHLAHSTPTTLASLLLFKYTRFAIVFVHFHCKISTAWNVLHSLSAWPTPHSLFRSLLKWHLFNEPNLNFLNQYCCPNCCFVLIL